MPLPQFKTEKEFREQFIAPFLAKRGLIHVNHTHGAGEQGKDFFFADRDAFENTRFYAVQAKLGDIGSGKGSIPELIDQVRRCFTVRLRFHKDAHERGVSAVYVMASGKITPSAREELFEWCRRESFGDNVFCLDGDTLSRLQQTQQHAVDQEALSVLAGLSIELSNNLETCGVDGLLDLAGTSTTLLRTHAMTSFISRPTLELILTAYAILPVLKQTEILNTLLSMPLTDRLYSGSRQLAEKQIETCKSVSQTALDRIRNELSHVHARRSITIAVAE